MKLRTYITETITEVAEGIISAQQILKEKGVIVNPNPVINGGGFFIQT